MFEFLSSPFGLVAVGLGVLAVAVLALCLWISTLDRRMRGMADGLEAERRKVAEMQMVIGRRNNAARSYGNRARVAQPAVGYGMPMGAPVPAASMPRQAMPAQAPAPASAPRPAAQPAAQPGARAPQPSGMPGQMPAGAWPQRGGIAQQPVAMPGKKMSRKARRAAERAFAERAAAELEARRARRAAEAAAAQQAAAAQAAAQSGDASAPATTPTRGRHAR